MREALYSNNLENLTIIAFVGGSTASFLSSSHVGEVARSAIRLGWPVTTVLQAACTPSANNCARPRGGVFDDLAIYAEKLLGPILFTLNRPFKATVLIFAISASFLVY